MFRIVAINLLALCIANAVYAADDFMMQYLMCGKQSTRSECTKNVDAEYCDKFAKLPDDVQEVIAKEMHCGFLAGEIAGEPELDKPLYSAIEAMGCLHRDSDIIGIVRKYVDDAKILRAILFFGEDYDKAILKCQKK
jgi:hypothetical protein